jgi:hypothetical protein
MSLSWGIELMVWVAVLVVRCLEFNFGSNALTGPWITKEMARHD